MFFENYANSQTFDVFIANDSVVNATTYEFDVFLRSTSVSPWAFRTIQLAFYINPAWLPAGNSPAISYITGSTTLLNYSPNSIQMNASPNSLSAFQVASNLAGLCGSGTLFNNSGQTEKVGRFRILSNSGPMNCVPCNISMIRPTIDSLAGTNVNIKMAVTKWTDPNCVPGTSTVISNSGTYTSIAGNTLLNEFNNMAPIVNALQDTVGSDCTNATFSAMASGIAGQPAPLTYQWYENGILLSNNSIYSGVNTAQLTLTNPPLSLNGKTYFVLVSQCSERASSSATLTVTPCTGLSEVKKNNSVFVFPNPSPGKFNIIFEGNEKPIGIEILNLLNQIVYKKESIVFQKSNTEILDLPIAKGTYIVKLIFKDISVQKMIVIN
jgi:hypothetical protein